MPLFLHRLARSQRSASEDSDGQNSGWEAASRRTGRRVIALLVAALHHSRQMQAERTLERYRDLISHAERNILRELDNHSRKREPLVSEGASGRASRAQFPNVTDKTTIAAVLVVLLSMAGVAEVIWQHSYLVQIIQREKINLFGYLASSLALATFSLQSMRRLRMMALASNLAFIAYGYLGDLMPVLILHAVLLPVNACRLMQLSRPNSTKAGSWTNRRVMRKGAGQGATPENVMSRHEPEPAKMKIGGTSRLASIPERAAEESSAR